MKLYHGSSYVIAHPKVNGYELAKYADLSYPTISALRQEKRDINRVQAKSLYKISTYLHLRLESLLH